jgi:transposase
MIEKEEYAVIEAMAERGMYLKDIARQVGVHPKTVSRALARGRAPTGPKGRRGRLLEPYLARVDQLLAEEVWNAVVIFRELQGAGYRGGISILRDYITPRRLLRHGRTTVRFETEPGRQLQSDWGERRIEVGGQETRVCFQANLLAYSRRFHFWCTDCMDGEHTYEGLIRAFEYFRGVPQEVLVDNQKTAVLERRGGAVRFCPRFVDLAERYGFLPRACRPYRARTKGKDERIVGYIANHFFVRYRSFESWEELNQTAERWLGEEADRRFHRTVQEVVAERFMREAPHLGPLPSSRYDTAYRETRQVGWDGYIDVRGNRYSVPHELAGSTVVVRISLDGELRVYRDDEVVATHRLRPGREGWSTVPAHHAGLWEQTVGVARRSLATYEEATGWN